MAMNRSLSQEKRQDRLVLDLVREVLGMRPLYTQKPEAPHVWMTRLGEAYRGITPAQTSKKGGTW